MPKILYYPRIRSDHNEDETSNILQTWVQNVRDLYHGIDIDTTNIEEKYSDAEGANHWSEMRFKRLIELRQAALDEARRVWADYIFVSCVMIVKTNLIYGG